MTQTEFNASVQAEIRRLVLMAEREYLEREYPVVSPFDISNYLPQRQVKVGDRVRLRPQQGSGAPIEVEVIGVGKENGQPVIDYRDARGVEHWAYLDQVDEVL